MLGGLAPDVIPRLQAINPNYDWSKAIQEYVPVLNSAYGSDWMDPARGSSAGLVSVLVQKAQADGQKWAASALPAARQAQQQQQAEIQRAQNPPDKGLFGGLGPLAQLAALIPGPQQPFLMAANAANSLSQGNLIGAGLNAFGAYNGGLGGAFDAVKGALPSFNAGALTDAPYTYTVNDGALGDTGSFNASSVDVNDAGGSMDYDLGDWQDFGGGSGGALVGENPWGPGTPNPSVDNLTGNYRSPYGTELGLSPGGSLSGGTPYDLAGVLNPGESTGSAFADFSGPGMSSGFPSWAKSLPDAAKKLLFGESGKSGLIGGALSGDMGSIAKTALIAGAIKDLLSNQSIPLADETKAALQKSLEAADAFATQNAPALSGNQNAAIAYARDNAGAGRGALTESRDLLNRSAVGPTAAEVDTYVNPYTKGALQENLHYLGDSAVGPTGADIEQYLNPYTRNVIDVALADQERANAKLVNADAAKAMGVGAFGGSRALMQEKEMRDAGLRAMGATSGALGRDAYDKSLKAAFDVKDNQFRVGDVAAKGLNTIYDKGLDATFRGKDNMRAAGTALTTNAGEEFKNYIGTTETLAETGAIEQQPEVVRYNQKRDAANLYGNAAANTSRSAAALRPPSPLGQLGSAFGVYNAANKALGVL